MLPPTKPLATLRPQREIEERLWLLLAQLPYAEEENEDRECAYLTGLFFALGADWTDARLAALKLWGERTVKPALTDPQCAICDSWNVDEEGDYEPPGRHFRCRNCGDTWVEHDPLANAELLAQMQKVMVD